MAAEEGGSDVRESSGFRFDIYERVRLPEEAADIHEIEEIELTPCVQAETRGEQVVLRGSLLLGGVYQSDDESRTSRQLEHWIPVEITLPRDRVGSLEDLAVEVDNFDVDLLDGRTLNITGVLTLRGVESGPSAARQQTYAWGDEPYTVVHRRGRDVIGEAAAESAGESGEPADEYAQADSEYAQADGEYARTDGDKAQEDGESELSFVSVGGAAPDREPAEWRPAGDGLAEGPAQRGGADPEDAAFDDPSYSASDVRAEAATSGDEYAAQPELRREPVQQPEPLEWKAFAARVQEQSEAVADQAERHADQAEGGESGSDPDAASGQSAADAGEAGVRDGAAQAESPAAAEARNGAQENLPQDPAAEGAPLSAGGGIPQSSSGKADLKVAFGAKRTEASGADGSAGIGKLLFPERREARGEAEPKAEEAREPEREPEPAEAEQRQASSDEVDWRSLFRGAAAQETFRTVRLCIVQKDDTLDSIALRYQRNPREIALVNRLEGSSVAEGQVLYIP
mgnify:CR=1 FL=1